MTIDDVLLAALNESPAPVLCAATGILDRDPRLVLSCGPLMGPLCSKTGSLGSNESLAPPSSSFSMTAPEEQDSRSEAKRGGEGAGAGIDKVPCESEWGTTSTTGFDLVSLSDPPRRRVALSMNGESSSSKKEKERG